MTFLSGIFALLSSSFPSAVQLTLEMLILDHFALPFPLICAMMPAGQRKKNVAKAVTSWNERLTYKGVSLHISAQRVGGCNKTKIHQGAERHCYWLTKWVAVR